MPLITAETVKRVLKDVYGYDISDENAGPAANTAGAMISLSENLRSLGLDDIEPPFGFANMMAEALRHAAKK
jgi:hypothetical protein